MTVRELIAELQKHDPELIVVHSTGMMQDREEVRSVNVGEPDRTAWSQDMRHLVDGTWIEVC